MRNIEPETVYSKNSDRATVKISEFHKLIVVEVATPNHQISQILKLFSTETSWQRYSEDFQLCHCCTIGKVPGIRPNKRKAPWLNFSGPPFRL